MKTSAVGCWLFAIGYWYFVYRLLWALIRNSSPLCNHSLFALGQIVLWALNFFYMLLCLHAWIHSSLVATCSSSLVLCKLPRGHSCFLLAPQRNIKQCRNDNRCARLYWIASHMYCVPNGHSHSMSQTSPPLTHTSQVVKTLENLPSLPINHVMGS